jgi:hypothetical protein
MRHTQRLITHIRAHFNIDVTPASLLVTVAQISDAVGLVFDFALPCVAGGLNFRRTHRISLAVCQNLLNWKGMALKIVIDGAVTMKKL